MLSNPGSSPQALHAFVSVLSLALGLVGSIYVWARAESSSRPPEEEVVALGPTHPADWNTTVPFQPVVVLLGKLLGLSNASFSAGQVPPTASPPWSSVLESAPSTTASLPFTTAAVATATALPPSSSSTTTTTPATPSLPTLLTTLLPWLRSYLRTIQPPTLITFVLLMLIVLVLYLTNPGDISFQSFLTDLSFREHLKAAQDNLRALVRAEQAASGEASAEISDRLRDRLGQVYEPSPHMLSFANHLAISVKTPAYTRYDYGLFSVVIVSRRSITSPPAPPSSSTSTSSGSYAPSSAPQPPATTTTTTTTDAPDQPHPTPIAGLLSAIEDRSYWFFGGLGGWYIGTPNWAQTFLSDVKRAALVGQAWHDPTRGEKDSWGVLAMSNDTFDLDSSSKKGGDKREAGRTLDAEPTPSSVGGSSVPLPSQQPACTSTGTADAATLRAAIAEARSQTTEAQAALNHVQTTGSTTQASLQAELDTIRSTKKSEDQGRNDLKLHMKRLDESKRSAEVEHRAAERALASAQSVRAKRLEGLESRTKQLEHLRRQIAAARERQRTCLEQRTAHVEQGNKAKEEGQKRLEAKHKHLAGFLAEEARLADQVARSRQELEAARQRYAWAETEAVQRALVQQANLPYVPSIQTPTAPPPPPPPPPPNAPFDLSGEHASLYASDSRELLDPFAPPSPVAHAQPNGATGPAAPSAVPPATAHPAILAPHPVQPILFPPRVDMEDDLEFSAAQSPLPGTSWTTRQQDSSSPFATGLLPSNLLHLDDDPHTNLVSPSRVTDALAQLRVQPGFGGGHGGQSDYDGGRAALDLDRPPLSWLGVDALEEHPHGGDAQPLESEDEDEVPETTKGNHHRRWFTRKPKDETQHHDPGEVGGSKRRSLLPRWGRDRGAMETDYEAVRRAFQLPLQGDSADDLSRKSWYALPSSGDPWRPMMPHHPSLEFNPLGPHASDSADRWGRAPRDHAGARFSTESMPMLGALGGSSWSLNASGNGTAGNGAMPWQTPSTDQANALLRAWHAHHVPSSDAGTLNRNDGAPAWEGQDAQRHAQHASQHAQHLVVGGPSFESLVPSLASRTSHAPPGTATTRSVSAPMGSNSSIHASTTDSSDVPATEVLGETKLSTSSSSNGTGTTPSKLKFWRRDRPTSSKSKDQAV